MRKINQIKKLLKQILSLDTNIFTLTEVHKSGYTISIRRLDREPFNYFFPLFYLEAVPAETLALIILRAYCLWMWHDTKQSESSSKLQEREYQG